MLSLSIFQTGELIARLEGLVAKQVAVADRDAYLNEVILPEVSRTYTSVSKLKK